MFAIPLCEFKNFDMKAAHCEVEMGLLATNVEN